jgi:protocatechuate 3,4-dioxygenase beta subunit
MTQPNDSHEHDRGLRHDLPKLIQRRKALFALGGLGVLAAGGYGMFATAETTATASDGSTCVSDATETAGPYPADGTNAKAGQTVNVLEQSGVIREDLRPSFAGMTPVADGLKLTLALQLVNANAACTPLAGHALYLWHCDTIGQYSLYDTTDRNDLRGVGVSDAQGIVRFTTIFPGCYNGRWPHFHFEVFGSVDDIETGRDSLLISQLALPEAECAAVYDTDARYANGTRNLGRQSLTRDMIFRDSSDAQMAQRTVSLSGTAQTGYAGKAMIALAV